jgi:single-stranded-DNA-specific exonuclease
VVGFTGERGRGSARTLNGFDLHAAFTACREHLVVGGGHAAAAGLTVEVARFAAFREAFVAAAAAHAPGGDPTAEADVEAGLGELDLPQVEELARLGPFGQANGEPLVALPGVVVRATRVVGQGHLQLTLSREGAVMDAIGFGLAAEAPPEGSTLDVLAIPEVDSYRGYRRPRLRVRRIFKAES